MVTSSTWIHAGLIHCTDPAGADDLSGDAAGQCEEGESSMNDAEEMVEPGLGLEEARM